MILDARNVPDGRELESEVCIIGAGAVGISLAREYKDRRFRTILLESGGPEPEPETQALYQGEIVGHPYYSLDSSRLRFLGGTTNHWGGMCLPFDEIDFEERSWVPHSGWPIGLADLEPFYRRAQVLCELGPYDYRVAYWMKRRGKAPLPIKGGPIVPRIAQFSPPTRFGTRYREALEQARSVSTYLHANVLEFETDRSSRTVERVNVASLGGSRFTVSARVFILAAGAIENARILLLSRKGSPKGLGNQHDLVGRYFMERVNYRSGIFVPEDGALWEPFFELDRIGKLGINGFLGTDTAWQRKSEALNSSLHLHTTVSDNLSDRAWDVIAGLWDRSIHGRQPAANYFDIWHDVEPVPNPSSRVRLAEARDALGQPRIELDWRLSPELEGRTIRRVLRAFATEMGRQGQGRVRSEIPDQGDGWSEEVVGSFHQMGTTRMHSDPRQGVVDADCRVHGISNLYITGSSIFPTAGQANPTLTLLALALRLGDGIAETFA
jgi:choline dehydrogenase-like flavoprotein